MAMAPPSAELSYASEQWRKLMQELGVPAELSETWWSTVAAYYTEPHRHYHTLSHIMAMLKGLQSLGLQPHRPHLVLLAIFFHDIIYDPKSGTNEEDSAALYNTFAAAVGQGAAEAAVVHHYILATKTHTAAESAHDPDLSIVLDVDLAILGADSSTYAEYARQIRCEYAHVPSDVYCAKRAAVLRELSSSAHLYSTATCRAQLEANARQNLAAEIALLDAQRVPSGAVDDSGSLC
jgi:predicted metal-dependent HD superfamily phosphohydrolase